jgi:hypothetical protein
MKGVLAALEAGRLPAGSCHFVTPVKGGASPIGAKGANFISLADRL